MELEVELDEQHLERLSAASPLTGVIELIWNALDADAEEIKVEFARNDLDGVEEIRVVDDGHGMTQQEVVEGFGRLGGSWKRRSRVSRKGRALHGRDGRGRFLAAGLGGRIQWRTVAVDPNDSSRRLAVNVEMALPHLTHVEISDPAPTDDDTGTKVLIDGFMKDPIGLGGDTPIEKLTGTFGLYLQTNNAHLTFDREEIDPGALQARRDEFEIPTDSADPALFIVIEWKRRVDRAHRQGSP